MTSKTIEDLRQVLGADKVRTDEAVLSERRRDYSAPNELADLLGWGAPNPACVIQPASTADVVKAVNVCRENKALLVPFGLGSGVCTGIVATPDTIVLDMSSMNNMRSLSKENLLVTFDAGVRGSDAEAMLNKEGLTTGHYPQSIELSTVGGWVSTRASGQFSSAYGNTEDIVMGLEVVLPNGEVYETKLTPRASAGPDLRHLFIGAEGTMGVVTAVTFALHRMPEKREDTAFYCADMTAGLELQRQIMQTGWKPPVMRLYDTHETVDKFPDVARGEDCLLIMVHEGPATRTDAEVEAVRAIAKEQGCDEAPSKVVDDWFKVRNHVGGFTTPLKANISVDTIEIAAEWDKIGGIYDAAIASLKEVPGMISGSAHSSHCYMTGINLYFTFVAQAKDGSELDDLYYECWRRVMEATIARGGGIAHHHGIGRVRRDYMVQEIGETGVNLLKALKKALDPDNMLNPDILIPHG